MQSRPANAFISELEFECFSKLANKYYQGKGSIVDAGCYVGATTLALCSGVADKYWSLDGSPSLIAIDQFQALDNYILDDLLQSGIDIRYGESFLPIFMRNLREYLGRIEVRAGDVFKVGRLESEIAILLIDISKTPGINSFVLWNWFPRLIAGVSVVVQQDFYSPDHPWIPVSMGALMEYFEHVEEAVGESAIFKLRKAIPAIVLRETMRIDVRSPSAIASLERMISSLSAQSRGPLFLTRALLLHAAGEREAATHSLELALQSDGALGFEKWTRWVRSTVSRVRPDLLPES